MHVGVALCQAVGDIFRLAGSSEWGWAGWDGGEVALG